MLERIQTGNEAANKVLRLILTRAEAEPAHYREDVRAGIQSMHFRYATLTGQTGLDTHDVKQALAYLDDRGYLKVDMEYPREDDQEPYGVHIWTRSWLEPAA